MYICMYSSIISIRRSTYRTAWEKDFPWLRAVRNDVHQAQCIVCKAVFQICGSGKAQVQTHGAGNRHKELEKIHAENRKIVRSKSTSKTPLSLNAVLNFFSEQEKIPKTEILNALKVVKYHQSFRSVEQDCKIFSQLFPDSKLKYIIRFGIAPYLKEVITAELSNEAFSFTFDETTTAQKKKQLDGYISYVDSKYCLRRLHWLMVL
jgi:hypothetical protein